MLTRWVVSVMPCCGRPREEPEEIVSSESAPCSIEWGRGGTGSAGASMPFLVVDAERWPVKSPLALGAEATRRMKREAEAPIALGDSGPERDVDWTGGRLKEPWDGPAVEDFGSMALGLRERGCFPDFVRAREEEEAASESASTDCWWRGWERAWEPRDGPRPRFESLDWVLDELDDERCSDTKEAGVSEAVEVSGVRPLPTLEVDRE